MHALLQHRHVWEGFRSFILVGERMAGGGVDVNVVTAAWNCSSLNWIWNISGVCEVLIIHHSEYAVV